MLIFLCEYIGKYFHRRRGTYIYYCHSVAGSNLPVAACLQHHVLTCLNSNQRTKRVKVSNKRHVLTQKLCSTQKVGLIMSKFHPKWLNTCKVMHAAVKPRSAALSGVRTAAITGRAHRRTTRIPPHHLCVHHNAASWWQ